MPTMLKITGQDHAMFGAEGLFQISTLKNAALANAQSGGPERFRIAICTFRGQPSCSQGQAMSARRCERRAGVRGEILEAVR